jgi:hypothetical protein
MVSEVAVRHGATIRGLEFRNQQSPILVVHCPPKGYSSASTVRNILCTEYLLLPVRAALPHNQFKLNIPVILRFACCLGFPRFLLFRSTFQPEKPAYITQPIPQWPLSDGDPRLAAYLLSYPSRYGTGIMHLHQETIPSGSSDSMLLGRS